MSDSIVVDASVVLKWTIEEPYFEKARELLAEWAERRTRVMAPSLLGFEIVNAIHRRVHRGEFTEQDANFALDNLLNLGISLIYDIYMHFRALELSRHFRRPSSYDAHYIALAEREGCEFWTADERLWNTVRHELSWVRWIGETGDASRG